MFHACALQPISLSLQLVAAFAQASLAILTDSFSDPLDSFLDGCYLFTSTSTLSCFFTACLLVLAAISDDIFTEYSAVLCIADLRGLCTKNRLLSALEQSCKAIKISWEDMAEYVGYIRVSTREQAENTNALDQQRARIIEAGAQYVFEDVQQGRSNKRPAYNELMKLIERGKIRKIFITRIDRISRSLITLRKLVDTLTKYGVILVILDQKIDLETAQGKMVLNVLGMLAEWEVDLLSERTSVGKKYQRKNRWANPPRPWGYKVVNHKYVLDQTPFLCLLSERPDNYLDLNQLLDPAMLPGYTIAELARDCIDIFFVTKGARRALKVIFEKYGIVKPSEKFNGTNKIFHWSVRGFSLWLRNPVFDGHTRYRMYEVIDGKRKYFPDEQQEIHRDTHPTQRLFRDGEAEAVKTIIQANIHNGSGCFRQNSTGSDNYRRFSYQAGLVYCAECGSRCTSKGTGGENEEYLYYACRHVGLGCKNGRSVKRRHIEEALIEALVEKSQSFNHDDLAPAEPLSVNSEALACLEAQLAGLEQLPGFNPDIQALKLKLRQQIEEEANPFLSTEKMLDSSVEALIRAGNNLAIWHLLTSDEKVEIYRKLVNKIYIQDGKVISVVFNQ